MIHEHFDEPKDKTHPQVIKQLPKFITIKIVFKNVQFVSMNTKEIK